MTETRPLLVGENPSWSGDRYWRFPLSGRAARVLCEAAGWAPHGEPSDPGSWTWALYERFRVVNLFRRWADVEHGWPTTDARIRAHKVLYDEPDGGTIVVVGAKVARAFVSRPPLDRYASAVLDGRTIVHVPHPSPRNRVLNDAAEHVRLGETLRAVLSSQPGGTSG